MKKLLATVAALATMSTMAFAERYVMITHTKGTEPFWPVVEKARRDAAASSRDELEYHFAQIGEMSAQVQLNESAAATKPVGTDVN